MIRRGKGEDKDGPGPVYLPEEINDLHLALLFKCVCKCRTDSFPYTEPGSLDALAKDIRKATEAGLTMKVEQAG